MYTYLYTDEDAEGIPIFTYEGKTLGDADHAFEEEFGYNPNVEGNIALEVFDGAIQ